MKLPVSWVTIVAGTAALLFLILPNIIIVPVSFSPAEHYYEFPPQSFSTRWYEQFFSDARWVEALLRSGRIGAMSAAISVVIGTCGAFALGRGHFFGKKLATGLILAPLVVPHVILGAGLYVIYSNWQLLHSEAGLVLAHSLIGTPVVVIAVLASLRSLRRDLELAAMSLGAGYGRTFFKVTLPQVLPGILVGGVLAFVASFDELILAVFLSGVRSTTLPMKMWEGIVAENNPVLPAASTILVILSTTPMIIIELSKRWRSKPRQEGYAPET